MRGEVVARNYASALFDLALREDQVEEYGAGLQQVAELLQDVPGFRTFLETPSIDKREKKEVLRKAFGDRVPAPVVNFLLLVLDKRRQRLLATMSRQYRDLLDEHLGRAHVDVSVARPLDEAGVAAIREQLSRILEKDVIPHVQVRPELIGGIVFRSGDVVYDGSVRRRLEHMKRRLMTAEV
ncbi:MAG: ATP synthase F1 subunit delta [Gemmatimonadota bacterium]